MQSELVISRVVCCSLNGRSARKCGSKLGAPPSYHIPSLLQPHLPGGWQTMGSTPATPPTIKPTLFLCACPSYLATSWCCQFRM